MARQFWPEENNMENQELNNEEVVATPEITEAPTRGIPEEVAAEEATMPENTEYAPGDPAALRGSTEDGTIYDMTSPAVLAFQERFKDSGDAMDVIIGSVVTMHNNITKGETPAGENLEAIIEAIKVNIPSKE